MAKNGKGWLLALGVGGLVYFASRHAKAAGMKYRAPLKLTKNFDLLEFLNQHKGLESYAIDDFQYLSVLALATRILQPLRDKYGPIKISSGCRPPDWRDANGKTLDEILVNEGFHPARGSDHDWCGAADLQFDSPDKYLQAAIDVANNPATRQVILEYRTVDGKQVINTLHVAVVTPNHPKITGDAYAFVQLDGKTVGTIPWNKTLPNV